MAKIFTLYNHKGGVSKTTTTFNVAHALADQGHKILVVDADPQCNITELMLINVIKEADEKSVDSGSDVPLPGTSLLEALLPRIQGEVPAVDTSKVNAVKVTDNISIIRGDVNLSNIEDAISESHTQRFSSKIHEKRTYIAFYDFIDRFASENNFDYVIIDVGPSSGAITRTAFLSCDGFILPTVPDRFNIQAISTLSTIIDRWMTEHDQIIEDFRSLDLHIPEGKPVFIGSIIQSYTLYKGDPKRSYSYWMQRIPEQIDTKLLSVLKKHSKHNDLTRGLTKDTAVIASIPHFQSLAPVMQEAGKAVFHINAEDTKPLNNGSPYSGTVWTQTKERIDSYRAIFETITNTIVKSL